MQLMPSYGAQGNGPTTHLPHPTCHEAQALGPTPSLPHPTMPSLNHYGSFMAILINEFHVNSCSWMPFCKLQNSLVLRGPGQLPYYLLAPSRLLWGPGLRLHTLSFLIPPTGLLSPSLHEFHFSSCSRMLYCKLQHACSFLLLTTSRSNSCEQPRLPKLSLPPVSGHHPVFSTPCSQSPAARLYLSHIPFPQS